MVFQVGANGVSYKSAKIDRSITWSEIDELEETNLGFILHLGKQRQYISKSYLNEQAIEFMKQQHKVSKAN